MSREPQVGNQYRTPAAGHVRTSGEGRISVTINTDDLDRHGTVIEPAGAELAHYRRNPIVLAGHSMAKVLGTSNVRLENGKLVAEMTRWSESDVAQKWRADVAAGIVRAASVGFRVLEKEKARRPDGSTYWRITRWQLVEWSWVAVPSNPHAVARSIQPLTLRGDGSKRFPKHAPIHFTDRQFERLLSGNIHVNIGESVRKGRAVETGPKEETGRVAVGAGGEEYQHHEGAEALRPARRKPKRADVCLTDAQRRRYGLPVPMKGATGLPDPSKRYALRTADLPARWKLGARRQRRR